MNVMTSWRVGTDGEGDLKNRQPTSQSKDKNPLGEIKAGAVEAAGQPV